MSSKPHKFVHPSYRLNRLEKVRKVCEIVVFLMLRLPFKFREIDQIFAYQSTGIITCTNDFVMIYPKLPIIETWLSPH